ncbi:MAG: hypothetical protein K2K38_00875 [Clostridia bacterium]|nr:hypothetical protein [Clostridia bacterium]
MAGLALLAAISIIIVNAFIPVKYLSSYFVSKKSNEVGQMRVSFVDVGNSDCTIIELPDGKVLLIDGGDGTYSHNLKIFKELNRRKIDKIDYLVCSSVENSACGGLAEILNYKTVNRIYAPYCPVTYMSSGYKSFCDELKKSGKEPTYCEYGIGFGGAGYSFCFLSPDSHFYEGGEYDELVKNPTSQNVKNASAVIWLQYSDVNFLFLGSTGQAVQKKLIDYYNAMHLEFGGRTIDLTKCDIVKMSDHGSTEGAYAPFMDLIKPSTAILSVGENGRGLPTLPSLSNAQNSVGDSLYRTDELGTVTVTVKNGSYEVSKEKK